MSFKISKSFEFNYGHRIATQELDKTFSLDEQCKCRFFHGHTAVIEVTLQSDELKDGFVTDFYHLNWLKVWIQENIDHKFILDKDDPLYTSLFCNNVMGQDMDALVKMKEDKMGSVICVGNNSEDGRLPLEVSVPHVVEYYESFYFVNFPPTSECLAKWIYDFVEMKMKPLNVDVESVTWHESPKSKAVYSGSTHNE
jgi:6-pyruvoyltetrahydropterin/6-carboxytetrahydropterin synthase